MTLEEVKIRQLIWPENKLHSPGPTRIPATDPILGRLIGRPEHDPVRAGHVDDDPAAYLTDIGNHAQKTGAWLAAQTGSEDGETMKSLIDALPPMSLGVDFDPGDLMINGFSSSDAMRHLSAHVMSFRARDAVRDLAQGRGLEVQLGRGSIEWASLLAALEEHHYQGYITVDRQTDGDPIQECGHAIEYLTNMFD